MTIAEKIELLKQIADIANSSNRNAIIKKVDEELDKLLDQIIEAPITQEQNYYIDPNMFNVPCSSPTMPQEPYYGTSPTYTLSNNPNG